MAVMQLDYPSAAAEPGERKGGGVKQRAIGRLHERIAAVTDGWYAPYLVRGDHKTLMVDAGLSLLAPSYLASLRELLSEAGRLDYLLLTHSHYDHIGAAAHLKRHFPALRIGAHERVAGLLHKPTALDLMRRLTANHAEPADQGGGDEDLTLQPFEVDIHLKQGDEIDLGGLTCRIYETPGHTRDSLAFYLPEIKALLPGEACGVLQGEPGRKLQVEFLASFQAYVDSLRLMTALSPDIICLAHGWVLTGRDARALLLRSWTETFQYRALIESYLAAANGDVEAAIQDMAHTEYDMKGEIRQDRASYLTNLTAQVRHIAERQAQPPATGAVAS